MSTISEIIGQWVEAMDYSRIPEEVVSIAKRCILDFIGVALAGSREPTARVVGQYLDEVRGKEEATVIGLGIKAGCTEAAFGNGTIGHCLDYDDYIHPVPGAGGPHLTAVVLPAALAIAEKMNRSGKELIEAYVLGCEVAFRVGCAVEPEHYLWGWHNTGTHGVFGAAVAASKLLKLDSEQVAHALGIAGSEASGLRENFGTMTKPFHAGQASAKGVRAAILAKFGFTSAKAIFEGENGFFKVLCKHVRPNLLTHDLGQTFGLTKIRLKLYPCCGGSHCGIDATLDMVSQHNISAEDVDEITVRCPTLVSQVLVYESPRTALEGKFSMQFPLALALSERKVTLEQFTDEKVKHPEIAALMQKVKLITDPRLNVSDSLAQPTIVEIKLKGGRRLINRVEFPRGSPERPLSDEELVSKYRNCATAVLSEKETEDSCQLLMNLEQINNIKNLLDILRVK